MWKPPAQNRKPEEVLTDAVRKYLEAQSWRSSWSGMQRATATGIAEEDVDRLIAEYRAENQRHGH